MRDKISRIIEISEELAGLPAGSYHSSCRKEAYNLCRLCANNVMMRELSMDYNLLSKYIESRDRATLYVQYKNHEGNMEHWEVYRLFYTSLKEKFLANHVEGEYLDRDRYDTILYRNGIQSTPDIHRDHQKIAITVCVGNFEGKIYRTPLSVPKALKTIMDAFIDYKYNIKINKIEKYERIYQTTQKDSRE